MNLSKLPIGVTDSGIGGLNVLNFLINSFPTESFIYLGDNHNAPYGNKSLIELKNLFFQTINTFLDVKVKGVVVACNTISTTLLQDKKLKLPFFAIPTLPPKKLDKNSYLICTENTAKSNYAKALYGENIFPLKDLAKEIELNAENLNQKNFNKFFENFPKTASSVAIGCTHYSFIKKNIEVALNLPVYDGYEAVITSLKTALIGIENHAKTQSVSFIGSAKKYNEKIYKTVFQRR